MSATRAPARAQVVVQLAAEPGQPAVDQRHAVAVFDQVAVDERVAEPVHSRGHLRRCFGHGRAAWQGSNPLGRGKRLDEARAEPVPCLRPMALFTAHFDALMPAPTGTTSWSEARAKGRHQRPAAARLLAERSSHAPVREHRGRASSDALDPRINHREDPRVERPVRRAAVLGRLEPLAGPLARAGMACRALPRGLWPSTNAAKRPFDGSFDAAVRAAGLEPHRSGPRRRAAGCRASRRGAARAAGSP